jgi:hypothetical protein
MVSGLAYALFVPQCAYVCGWQLLCTSLLILSRQGCCHVVVQYHSKRRQDGLNQVNVVLSSAGSAVRVQGSSLHGVGWRAVVSLA